MSPSATPTAIPRCSYAATIHHGIDTDSFSLHAAPGDHLLFFGRIHPDKGTATAIEVARLAGRPLVIAGIIQDQEYFDREVAPHLDGVQTTYVGPGRCGGTRTVSSAARPPSFT